MKILLSFFLFIMSMFVHAQAYYVSPAGNDYNPGTLAAPFQTLEKAQAAMRGSSTKTTYLRGGTYNRTTTLNLTAADKDESWLGYSGEIPIIDGQNNVATAIQISDAENITIRWLTIQNYTTNGIKAGKVNNILIDSNTIKHITSTGWTQGAILFPGSGMFKNVKISHNYIQDLGYNGISIHAVSGCDISNLVIEYNIVYDYLKTVSDGGGIYIMDRGHSGVPVRVANNIVGNFGTPKGASKHYYMDDLMSNVTIENNIGFGACSWAIQYHGGDNITVRNNIFDITLAGKLAYYQDVPSVGDFGMANNSFTCNIVYSSGTMPSELWNCSIAATDALLNVSGNDYWHSGGITMPNSGKIIDSNPLKINPGFVNAANHDYRFEGSSPMTCFQSIDISKIGPLPNGSPATGINNIQSKPGSQLILYPNPLKNTDLTISLEGITGGENKNIAIYNISGRSVYQKQLDKTLGESSITISQNVFTTTGVYLVKGFCGNKLNGVAKLVVE